MVSNQRLLIFRLYIIYIIYGKVIIMRLLTSKELNKIFSLRQSKSVKSRVRKKNHKRVMRYLDKYGLVTVDMLKKPTHV